MFSLIKAINRLINKEIYVLLLLFITYLIFKVLLQLSIKYKLLELEIYTNTIVKYNNNYIYTTKTSRTIRSKDLFDVFNGCLV